TKTFRFAEKRCSPAGRAASVSRIKAVRQPVRSRRAWRVHAYLNPIRDGLPTTSLLCPGSLIPAKFMAASEVWRWRAATHSRVKLNHPGTFCRDLTTMPAVPYDRAYE